VPIVIGGKGDAAVQRAARYGDGWLAIFCSARRFAQTKEQIAEAAAALGRPAPPWYGINVWAGLDANAAQARNLLASQLEGLYHLPFGKFERLTPAGPAAQVAEALAPTVRRVRSTSPCPRGRLARGRRGARRRRPRGAG
jgi:alkanesulfonate monooxygenase SsuD/methylene tetrahydromethanopterin reductase-like flavin-dependent oxidoreductase (luciferase family)